MIAPRALGPAAASSARHAANRPHRSVEHAAIPRITPAFDFWKRYEPAHHYISQPTLPVLRTVSLTPTLATRWESTSQLRDEFA